MKLQITLLALIFGLTGFGPAYAEIERSDFSDGNIVIGVSGEDWQPDGFELGMSIPAAYVRQADIKLDGRDHEPEWNTTTEVRVPLSFGDTGQAFVKALYTDDRVYFRVRWADSTEDRNHHPWVWDAEQKQYIAGPQVEDSILLSFEAGCNWNPSLLAGYQYDFDGWHWLAARSDPVGQAWDLMGNIADQDHALLKPTPYPSRTKEDVWNLKFNGDEGEEISHRSWQELDRSYFYGPVRPTSYYRAEIDGTGVTEIGRQLPTSQKPPSAGSQMIPQFTPVKLEGDAGEIGAKGHWENGFWTVEFSRILRTPSSTATDTEFTRLTQFSIHVFDQTERIDEASESTRLFLEFLPQEIQVAQDARQ